MITPTSSDRRHQDDLVTIVIACFDTDPDQLGAAVESARAQTYEPVEIIVVDDGSTAAATLARLSDLPQDVRVISQPNGGVAAARNHGMRQASGVFLLPLDGDDVLEPGYLAATVPVLRQDPGLAVVSTRATYFGARTGPVDLPDPSLPWMVAENSIHNTSLFRRADFDRLGGYDEGLRGFEDHEWWLRLLLDGGQALVLDEELFRYRIRPSSRNASVSSSSDALRELRQAIVRNNPTHAAALTSMVFETLDVALWRMHEAESRVAHLEHHLGPLVRVLDRHPGIKRELERLRRLKGRARHRQA